MKTSKTNYMIIYSCFIFLGSFLHTAIFEQGKPIDLSSVFLLPFCNGCRNLFLSFMHFENRINTKFREEIIVFIEHYFIINNPLLPSILKFRIRLFSHFRNLINTIIVFHVIFHRLAIILINRPFLLPCPCTRFLPLN